MVQRVLRPTAVIGLTGDSRSALYARAKAGLWTRPIKINGAGTRAAGWPETEVAALQAARIAGKSHDEVRALVRTLEAQRQEVSA